MADLTGETPADILSHHADADAVDSFIAYRKKHKRAALTDRGARMLAKSLAEINADGGDATEALDLAQEHGWQTVKSEWYWRHKSGGTSYRNPSADASARRISIAARANRASGKDLF